MKISAIIPAYNASKFLERSVKSLIDTEYPQLEIIIVDDGSKDDTYDVACELAKRYPEIVSVYHHSGKANLRAAASRNLGILKCTGELICFLDADDVVYPHRFEVSVHLLESNPDIDGVYEVSKMVFDVDSRGESVAEWGEFYGLTHRVHSAEILSELLRGKTWHTSGILCRRSLLDKTGLFNTTPRIAEDNNLWFKMASVGKIVPGDMTRAVSEYHRHGENSYILSIDKKPIMVRAMVDACSWAHRRGLSGVVLNEFFTQTRVYISDSIAIAIQANRVDLAWEIIKVALNDGGVVIFANLRLLRTVAWLCRRTILD